MILSSRWLFQLIFYLLLNMNRPQELDYQMIGLLFWVHLFTTAGILVSWSSLSPEIILVNDVKTVVGMLTGTYT